MRWIELDVRLKELYNSIVVAHSDTVGDITASKAEARAYELLEEIDKILKQHL